MKVISFKPKANELDSLGLSQVEFRELGNVVLLAGPNGGGKSRILQLIKDLQNAPFNNNIDELEAKLQQTKSSRLSQQLEVAALKHQHDEVGIKNYEYSIRQQKEVEKNLSSAITQIKAGITAKWDPSKQKLSVIDFVPRQLNLHDPNLLSKNQIVINHNSVNKITKENGIHKLGNEVLSYIQLEQDNYWHATHDKYTGTLENKEKIILSYERLCKLIHQLLSTKIDRSSQGETLIFDKPIGNSQLSDGQKILLQLAIAIHPLSENEDFILVLDEPENYLHPNALLNILKQIEIVLPKTQLWIATHSVPLISHYFDKQPDCLHYVVDGKMKFAGRNPLIVLEGLLGDKTEREKLLRLIDLPHKLAYIQFATYCLLPPEVIGKQNKLDPQLNQIANILWSSNKKNKMKLLDIGAGKGRLLSGLEELDENVVDYLDYFAFDHSTEFKAHCEAQINEIYGSSKKWFDSPEVLFATNDKNTFDVAVLCNVLHEILPDTWPEFFGSSGLLQRSLNNEGHLLIVEDMRIPIGERPNGRGYFLLDTSHLKTLFCVTETDIRNSKFISHDERNDGRLKAHLISSDLLTRVSADSRKQAITELKATAIRELRKLKDIVTASFDEGQKYSLWSQQLANCVLYLEQM